MKKFLDFCRINVYKKESESKGSFSSLPQNMIMPPIKNSSWVMFFFIVSKKFLNDVYHPF